MQSAHGLQEAAEVGTFTLDAFACPTPCTTVRKSIEAELNALSRLGIGFTEVGRCNLRDFLFAGHSYLTRWRSFKVDGLIPVGG